MSSATPIRISFLLQPDTKGIKEFENQIVGSVTNAGRASTSAMNKAMADVERAIGPIGGRITSGLTNPLLKLGAAFGGITLAMYGIEKLAGVLDRVLVAPVKAMVEQTEKLEKWKIAISGVLGGLQRAGALGDAIFNASGSSILSNAQLRSVALLQSRLPSYAPQFALQNPNAVAQQVLGFGNMVAAYGAYAPDKSTDNALLAIRETLGGNFRTLRQMGVSPFELARSVGLRNANELAGDEGLTLQALQKYQSLYIPPESVGHAAGLVSTQLEKLWSVLDVAGEKIGRSGLLESLAHGIQYVGDTLREYIGSDNFTRHAQGMSDSLVRIFRNVGIGVEGFLNGLSGGRGATGTAEGLAKALDASGREIAMWTSKLPELANSLGNAIHMVASALTDAKQSLVGKAFSGPTATAASVLATQGWPALAAGRAGIVLNGLNTAGVTAAERAGGAALDAVPGSRNFMYGATGLSMGALLHIFAPGLYWNRGTTATPTARPSTPAFVAPAIPEYLNQILESVPHDALEGHGLEAAMKALQQQAGGLGGGYGEVDKLTLAANQFRGTARDLFKNFKIDPESKTEEPGDVFAKVQGLYDLYQSTISDALDAVTSAAISDALAGQMGNLGSYRDRIIALASAQKSLGNVPDLRDKVLKTIAGGGAQGGIGIANLIGHESASAQSQVLGLILSGQLPEQNLLASNLRRDGTTVDQSRMFGLANMSTEQQSLLLERFLTASEHENASFAAAQGLSSLGTKQRLLSIYQNQALPAASDVLSRAQAAAGDGEPSTPKLLALAEAQNTVDQLKGKIRDLRVETDLGLHALIELGDKLQETFGQTLADSLTALEEHTGNLRDLWKSFAHELLTDANRLAIQSLLSGIFQGQGGDNGKSGVGGLFFQLATGIGKGLFHGGGGPYPTANPDPAEARGDAFLHGRIFPFAYGGIVTRPTIFPMANGGTGLMGEKGYEAIMPLQRDPSGRLGVIAAGGHGQGEGGSGNVIHQTVNIQTPDVSSFRASSRQVADGLRRAMK